jgi:MFS family permease
MISSIVALNALNFFMADVRDGLGPFLGVFLQSKHWSPNEIGTVMTVGGLAAVATTAPLGALVDRLRAKRALIIVAALVITAAAVAILTFPTFPVTATAQAANGIAAAVVAPALTGITLGLVKQRGFAHQIGRNEAFNHAGNVAAALLAGGLGYGFGFAAVFGVMAAMALASIVATLLIDPGKIDHRAARGLAEEREDHAGSFKVLLACKPLLVLAATLLLFHLGNAAMLPLLGQALVARGAGDPSAYTAATIVIAQLTMVPVALIAAKIAGQRGYWMLFVAALIALPVRGAIAGLVTGPIGLVPVQILDGVGAGLLGVAVPGLTARMLDGTGHVNAGLGAVMACQGLGGALSPAFGGCVAGALGYSAAFFLLGGVAIFALLLWLSTTAALAQTCASGTDGRKHPKEPEGALATPARAANLP